MSQFNASGSKYLRPIQTVDGCVDVYAVLDAFDVRCPARQHAIKKLLCAGIRGKGGVMQDLAEARDAVSRAVDLEAGRGAEILDGGSKLDGDCQLYTGKCSCPNGEPICVPRQG